MLKVIESVKQGNKVNIVKELVEGNITINLIRQLTSRRLKDIRDY